MDDVPVGAWLDAWSPPIRSVALELRDAVRTAAPDLRERIRHGWRVIGYDLPGPRRGSYLGGIAPEPGHVHLYLQRGSLMRRRPRLEGAHLGLRSVRFLTFESGERVDRALVADVVLEAAAIAGMSPAERALLGEHAQGDGFAPAAATAAAASSAPRR